MRKINFKNNKTQSVIAAAVVIGLLAVNPSIYSAYAQTFQSQFGGFGTGNGQFESPVGVALDGSTHIYVVDMDNSRVEKFDSTGTYQSQFGTSGTGQLDFPRGIAIDSSGNSWVTDTGNDRVVEFDSTGNYKAQFTNVNGVFSSPNGIAFDNSGNVWVADSGNNRVVEFDTLGNYITQYTSANSATFRSPQYVAFDSSGNIWIADSSNNRVVELSSTGSFKLQIGCSSGACTGGTNNGQFFGTEGIAFDSSGDVWIVDKVNDRVQAFNTSGTYQTQIGCGTGACGGGTGNGAFDGPIGLAIDGNDKLYVVDEGNNLVQIFQ